MKLVRFNVLLLLFPVLYLGCAEPSSRDENPQLVLNQSQVCVDSVKTGIEAFLGSHKVHFHNSLFLNSSKLIISSQNSLEKFGEQKPVSRTFLLEKVDGHCYVTLLKQMDVKKRQAISCDCLVMKK